MDGKRQLFEHHAKRMDQVRQDTHLLFRKLKEYEETGLNFYTQNDMNKALVTSRQVKFNLMESEKNFQTEMQTTSHFTSNPYRNMFKWMR